MQRKRRWRKVVYFFIGLILAYVVGCFFLASRYVKPGVENDGPMPKGFLPAVGVNAWTSDFTNKPVFVLVHGYGGNQSGWTQVATALANKGFGVVIPALPGHDNRIEETSGFAVKESEIVVKTVEWIREKAGENTKVVLVGISMGGAACWLATERIKVEAVVSEGCFARLEPATKRWFDRKAPYASTYLAPVLWFAKSLSGVDPAMVNPVEHAGRWKGRPALIVHGDQDQLFTLDDAKQLATASGGELWIVPGATHAHCSDVDFEGYVSRLIALAR